MHEICIYIVIGLFLLITELCYFKIARKFRIMDLPHHQSSHKGAVIRGGGIVFFFAYVLWSVMNGIYSIGGLVGLTILAVVSFIDDLYNVAPTIRLVCQFIAIIFLFYHSGLIQNNIHVVTILSLACVGTINIYNFMDGINGMTGGYTLVVALALLFVNELIIHFTETGLLVSVILALIVFNIFNFRKHAKCFAGDVGSLSAGFLMVFFVLRLVLTAQSMAWIVFFAVYIVDGAMTILHRVLLRENLLKPHKKHAYQIMANEMKIPHLVVSGIYMGLQALCCAVFIAWPNYYTFFVEIGVLVTLYLGFMNKYYCLHIEKN